MRKISIIILIIILSGCGYNAVYKNLDSQKIKLEISNVSGNEDFNKLLMMELNQHIKSNQGELYKIEINTNYNKIDYTKDATGKATEFELSLIAKFNVEHNGVKKEITLNDKFYTDALENKFEQKKYENTILKNFASSIKDQLIFRLSILYDN